MTRSNIIMNCAPAMNGVAAHDERRRGEVRPHEQRHAEQRHAGRAHRDDRDEEVHGRGDRRRARDLDAELEERLAEPARASDEAADSPSSRPRTLPKRNADRKIMRASGSSQNESAFRRGNAMSGAPSISGITKLPMPAKTGTRNSEDHQRRVLRHEAVVLLGRHELLPGWASSARKISAKQAADEEEDERRRDVLDADHLVVGVELEVVAPRVRAVLRVVLRPRRRADHPPEPVSKPPMPIRKPKTPAM